MELVKFIIVSYLGTPRICTRSGTSYVEAIYYESLNKLYSNK